MCVCLSIERVRAKRAAGVACSVLSYVSKVQFFEVQLQRNAATLAVFCNFDRSVCDDIFISKYVNNFI